MSQGGISASVSVQGMLRPKSMLAFKPLTEDGLSPEHAGLKC
jgi:hypothetical protein